MDWQLSDIVKSLKRYPLVTTLVLLAVFVSVFAIGPVLTRAGELLAIWVFPDPQQQMAIYNTPTPHQPSRTTNRPNDPEKESSPNFDSNGQRGDEITSAKKPSKRSLPDSAEKENQINGFVEDQTSPPRLMAMNRAPHTTIDHIHFDSAGWQTIFPLRNDTDPDSDVLSISSVNGQAPVDGMLMQLPSGIKYIFNSSTDSIAIGTEDLFSVLCDGQRAQENLFYSVSDNSGATSTGRISVTLGEIGSPPKNEAWDDVRFNQVDFLGNDIEPFDGIVTQNVQQCANACGEDTSCRAYSYHSERMRCYLKNGIDIPLENQSVQSGFFVKRPIQGYSDDPAIYLAGSFFSRKEFGGLPYLRKTKVRNMVECVRHCQNQICWGATFYRVGSEAFCKWKQLKISTDILVKPKNSSYSSFRLFKPPRLVAGNIQPTTLCR